MVLGHYIDPSARSHLWGTSPSTGTQPDACWNGNTGPQPFKLTLPHKAALISSEMQWKLDRLANISRSDCPQDCWKRIFFPSRNIGLEELQNSWPSPTMQSLTYYWNSGQEMAIKKNIDWDCLLYMLIKEHAFMEVFIYWNKNVGLFW